ncbi:MAG: hypothetical protein HY902_03060 [Deltaproteobacteria bacterium]|nr:hypothetical protein [Deltaproteobacteria bacterium]
MPQNHPLAVLAAILAAGLLAVGVSGCDDGHSHATTQQDISDVLYVGDANDEALTELLAAKAVVGAGAVVDMPAEGTQLSAKTAPTFAWHTEEQARLWPSLPRLVDRWFGVAPAYAHGDAVNGQAYLLVVSTPAQPKLLRVFTTQSSYQPAPAAWAKLVAAGGPYTALVTTARFDTGKITSDGGPFAGKPAHFAVVP